MTASPQFARKLPDFRCPASVLCSFRKVILLLGLIPLLLSQGCGFWVRNGETVPKSPPPGDPPPPPHQSGSITITPQYVALGPGQNFQFSATSSSGGTIEWQVNGTTGGSTSSGTIDNSGNFTAPASITQSENITVTAALTSSPTQNYATSIVAVILPGKIVCPPLTGNPQVAQYSVYLPAPGKVSAEFGTTTSYGRETWQVPTPSANGGQTSLYVAGMLGNTEYHIRGQIALSNGATLNDADMTCTTGAPPVTAKLNVTTPVGAPPQPGVEMWNTILPQSDVPAFATDLNGNVLWTYTFKGASVDYLQGIQLLPNGDFLMVLSYLSSLNVSQTGVLDEVREIDLVGNTVRSLTMSDLNQKLAASSLRDAGGNPYQLGSFHHSVLALPNGHWVLLATDKKTFTNLSGTTTPTTTVIGDALIDVDPTGNPVWAWNTFDHLDINRRPMNFPDWTHSNDILYSSDDHNLLLSVRHQNWIIKIEYLDGQGSGNILWHLGEGGDFKLVGATDPTDWFYAQHGLSFFTPNTMGVFRLGLMDNGNDRIFPSGPVYCKPSSTPVASCYSTVPLLEMNETNMTATMISHYIPGTSFFSYFGGNVDQLANGDVQANFCAAYNGAIIQELDPTSLQVVWQASTPQADQFHVSRLSSLYPGIQW